MANSRRRNRRLRGTGPHLAHIRREDLQNQMAQAQAQLDQTTAQHTKADQDFQRAKVLYSTQSLTKPDYDQSQEASMQHALRWTTQRPRSFNPIDAWRRRPEGAVLGIHPQPEYSLGSLCRRPRMLLRSRYRSRKGSLCAPDYVLSRVR